MKAFEACRRHIADDGVMLITVRPVEYWESDKDIPPDEAAKLRAAQRERGFAFRPHPRPAVDGDVTYGDTGISMAWLKSNLPPRWTVAAVDRSLDDKFQLYVFLRPA